MAKRILVTGGCGFLGSHVCEYFLNKGWEVISYDNMTKYELERTGLATKEARTHNFDILKNLGVEMVTEDVTDYETLEGYAKNCDYVVHTAAQPAMTISWEDPRLDFMTNALGTFNVLELSRNLKIPVALCATVHVYGNTINNDLVEGEKHYKRTPVSIDEHHSILKGVLTPLHASKGCGDIYAQTYIDTYDAQVCCFRLTGIYGTRQFGGEDHGWVANFSIRSLLKWPISIFGTGKQVRDIIYVTDVCSAFEAFYNTRKSGIYNIGGGEKTMISLLDCIDIIEEINQEKTEVIFDVDRHGDLRYFVSNIDKARENLGWEPKIMPQEGIKKLIDWIKETRDVFK